MAAMNTPGARVSARIEDWKRKLVDLSRRNHLLYFYHSRRATLNVLQPEIEEVFSRLVCDEKSWWFFLPDDEEEPLATGTQAADTEALLFPSKNNRARQDAHVKSPRRDSTELLTDIPDRKNLLGTLRNLERRSRNDFEERGTRILYAAFGMLRWTDAEESEVRSPLILMPVELHRESITDPFELRPVGEELILNPALAVKLETDFKVQMPSLPEDWDSINLDTYFKSVRQAVRKVKGDVIAECWIGLFSFHKLVIYQDLSEHSTNIAGHNIVRVLSGEEDKLPSIEALDPDKIDSELKPDDSYLVMDADSSQLVCVEMVKRGANPGYSRTAGNREESDYHQFSR